jgi:exopolysaccharide production protein ExoQ
VTTSSNLPPSRNLEPTRFYPSSRETVTPAHAVRSGYRLITQRKIIRSAARLLLFLLVLVFFIPTSGSAEDGSAFIRSALLAFLAISMLGIIQHLGTSVKLFLRTWPVWVLLLWFLLTSHWASYPDISIRRSIAYITIYLIAVSLAVSFEHPVDFQRPLYLGLALIFLANIVAAQIIPPNDAKLGVNGLYAQKNGAGVIALYVIMVMTFSIGLRRPLITKLFSACLVILGWAFLISTQAKTSYATAVCLSFIIPVLSYLLLKPKAYMLFAATVCALLFGVTVLVFQLMNVTLEELGKAIFVDLTFTNRTFIWNAIIPEIWHHPWTGAGFGSFWATGRLLNPINARPDEFFMDAKLINEAHNGYIDITLQAGFIGLALALVVMIRSVWQLCRAISIRPADRDGRVSCMIMLAVGLAIAIANLTESQVFQYSNPVGYLFVLIVVQAERWRLERAPIV